MKNNKGYTLIELIITLAIIGIMIVPIYDTFLSSNRVNLSSKRQISAAYLAQNEMETVKGMALNEFKLAFEAFDPESDKYDADNFDATSTNLVSNGNTDFTVAVRVENSPIDMTVSAVKITHFDETRDWNVKVEVPSTSTDGNVMANPTPDTRKFNLPIANKSVDLTVTFDGSNYTIEDGNTNNKVEFPITFPTGMPDDEKRLLIDIYGYDSQTDKWNFNIINNSGIAVSLKRFNDDDNNITVTADENSNNNIYISNAFPSMPVTPSTVKEWFLVTVTVTHNGTVYETIQSTVGK